MIRTLAIFVFTALSASPALGYQACFDLFALQPVVTGTDQVSEMIRYLETDTSILFNRQPTRTTEQFFHWIAERQRAQAYAVIHTPVVGATAEMKESYSKLITQAAESALAALAYVKSTSHFYRFTLLSLSQLFPAGHMMKLRQAINRSISRSNAILGEYLVAVSSPEFVALETSMAELTQEHRTEVSAAIIQQFGEEEYHRMLTMKMDVIAKREDGAPLWTEVKYFGRHREYSSIRGDDVLQKLIMIQRAARIIDPRSQIVLAITGPGWLSPEAVARYENAGITVRHFTPELQEITPVSTSRMLVPRDPTGGSLRL